MPTACRSRPRGARGAADLAPPLEISVAINGQIRGTTATDPFATLPALAALLADHGIHPRRGDMLLTGSPLPLYPVGPPDRVRVECPAIGAVTADLAAGSSKMGK